MHELSILQVVFVIGVGFVLGLFVLSVLLAVGNRNRLVGLVHWAGRKYAVLWRNTNDPAQTDGVIEQLFTTLHLLRHGGWRATHVSAIVNNVLDVLMLYILFIAVGHYLSFGPLLTGYGLPLLFSKIGMLPGGLGIVEASMGLIYSGLGVPRAVLVVVILVYRLLAFWIPTIVGFLLVPYLRRTPLAREKTRFAPGAS